MRVIVCGPRDFDDWLYLKGCLDSVHDKTPIERMATGAAAGADTLADTWARSKGIKVERYYALWRTHGAAAGPIRNAEMLKAEQPDEVIAFDVSRETKGTGHMVRIAKEAGVPVREFNNPRRRRRRKPVKMRGL